MMHRYAQIAASILALLLAAPLTAQELGPRLSGDARIGLAYERPPAWAQRETGLRMTTRTRLHLQFIGQTDGGMTFGANVELDTDHQRPKAQRIFIGN